MSVVPLSQIIAPILVQDPLSINISEHHKQAEIDAESHHLTTSLGSGSILLITGAHSCMMTDDLPDPNFTTFFETRPGQRLFYSTLGTSTLVDTVSSFYWVSGPVDVCYT